MPRRLLLLGGGPTHAQVLAAFAREPLAGADLALLSPDAHLVQPALLPAFVAGRVGVDGCRVDTAALAAAAGATWVQARVVAFDAATRTVTLADGRCFDADLVSLDEPGAADHDALPGAREHALALHPAERFVALFDGLVALAQERAIDVVVVGAGLEALQLSLALAERLGGGADERARIAWVRGAAEPLAGWPAVARRLADEALARQRITVLREDCAALRAGAAVLASGARLACDAALLATPPRPPRWLAASGLALGDDGRPPVDERLQVPALAGIFAPGPAGEAAAAALAAQLRRAVAAGPLQAARLRPAPWRWLRLGRHGAAVACGPLVMTGWPLAALCQRRDMRRLASWSATAPATEPAAGAAPAAAPAAEPPTEPHALGAAEPATRPAGN